VSDVIPKDIVMGRGHDESSDKDTDLSHGSCILVFIGLIVIGCQASVLIGIEPIPTNDDNKGQYYYNGKNLFQ
jgi:hypothetical protein